MNTDNFPLNFRAQIWEIATVLEIPTLAKCDSLHKWKHFKYYF